MTRNISFVLASLLAIGACADDKESAPQKKQIEVRFSASVGDQIFKCGTEYANLGVDEDASFTPKDMRFFVSAVELVDADGGLTPATFVADGKWQNEDVALIDLEDGCGDMGNAETNTRIIVEAEDRQYAGVRFQIGVPESRNHINAAEAKAPLNLTEMWWNWTGGYKFMRLEGPTNKDSGWRFHLGSTACDGTPDESISCKNANRPTVEISNFDFETDTINFDFAKFSATSTLANDNEAQPGCMSAPNDSDCAPFFQTLGLPFAGANNAAVTAFEKKQ